MRASLLALLTVTVCLAGCADSLDTTPSEDYVDPSTTELQAGKGAIAGLLIDDRFRPIAGGTLLLQEAGRTALSNANGEFSFLDVDPGSYTLRAKAEGHEASPSSVRVEEGAFAEASIVARRIASTDGLILTEEHAVFAYCSINALLPLSDACSLFDLSGESNRVFLTLDYAAVADSMTVLVTEFLADRPGDFYILGGKDLDSLGAQYYINEYVTGSYTKCINRVGEMYEPCLDTNLGSPFSVNETFNFLLYINGDYDEETGFGLPLTGVGADLAVKARFLFSAFLGEPEVDLDSYCVLC